MIGQEFIVATSYRLCRSSEREAALAAAESVELSA